MPAHRTQIERADRLTLILAARLFEREGQPLKAALYYDAAAAFPARVCANDTLRHRRDRLRKSMEAA